MDIGNRIYYWDPSERTRFESNEYTIYVLSDYEETNRLADTFWDFINNVCINASSPAHALHEIELTFEPVE